MVQILYHHRDRGTKRQTSLNARVDFDKICFISRCCYRALTWAATGDLEQDISIIKFSHNNMKVYLGLKYVF